MGRQLALKQSGAYKRVRTLHIKQAGEFVRARNAYIKQAGTWKPFLTPFNEWESIPNLLEITSYSAFSNHDTISTFLPDTVTPRVRNLNVLSGDVTVSLAPEAAGLTAGPIGWVPEVYQAGTWELNKVVYITNDVSAGVNSRNLSAAIYDVVADTITTLPNVVVPLRNVEYAGWMSRQGWNKGYLVAAGSTGNTVPYGIERRLYVYEYDKLAETVIQKTYLELDGLGIATDGLKAVTVADGRLLFADGAGGLRTYDPGTNSFFFHYVYQAADGYGIAMQRQHPSTAGNSTEPAVLIIPMVYVYSGEFENSPVHKKVVSVGVFEDLPLPNLGYEYGLAENAVFGVAVSPYSNLLAFNRLTGLPESAVQKSVLHLFYGD